MAPPALTPPPGYIPTKEASEILGMANPSNLLREIKLGRCKLELYEYTNTKRKVYFFNREAVIAERHRREMRKLL